MMNIDIGYYVGTFLIWDEQTYIDSIKYVGELVTYCAYVLVHQLSQDLSKFYLGLI